MISDIKELNFPEYATLDGATVTLQDMAEGTITAQVKMDGEITPDFSQDWAVEFKGHKFIMPLREPQGAKENTSLMATVDLTFRHWAVWQLKRWLFFTVQPVESGTVMPDKYIASVSLNLGDFCKLTGQVLGYYYGDSITIDLNPQWVYASAPTNVEISHSHVWDVLIKLYELYGVRWQMMPNGDAEHYVIKVGYKATEIDHIFEYGFEGGLLKVERQVQNENIRNMLYGRGGEKNLPYRYYKNVDADNHTFAADPDWVPELANVSFTELRGATFRSYVQGWKAKHYGGTATRDKAYAPWAWDKGYTDAKFDPVEYVKDDRSIARYGELMDGLDNNEDIYPTIQGVDPIGDNPDIGRVDEAVYVEQVQSDDVQQSTALTATATLPAVKGAKEMNRGGATTIDVRSGVWKVPEGAGNGYLNVGTPLVIVRWLSLLPMSQGFRVLDATKIVINTVSVRVWDVATGAEHSTAGLEGGKEYYFTASVNINNTYDNAGRYYIDLAFEDAKVVMSGADGNAAWGATFDVLVKNIWGSTKLSTETSEQYAERVWGPILGDRQGNEAKMVFSDGLLSLSEDYEFVITAMPKYESKLCSWQTWENGTWVTKEYMSEWRITLAKSDAEMEATGLYVPSTQQQGKAGDHFYFVGIDMPHEYVVWAEERLDEWKNDNLREVSEIKPTWVVTTDRVRLNNEGKAGALIDEIVPGRSLRLADKRFILNEGSSEAAHETLYVQSVTYTYRKPTKDDAALNPDVEMVLSDKYETVANPVETISGEVSALSRYVGSLSGMEQVARMVGDKLYLRKDGISDRSQSPTEFGARIGSVGFRQGLVGGKGWGVYEDDKGNVVVEADIIHARQGIEANEFVVNQTVVQGGKYVESAAWMEVSDVAEVSDGYICYFDRKGGSVKNLFMMGDVAMSEVFTPELSRMKFYKRRVVMVGEDFIKLAKEGSVTTRPSDWPDSGVNGTGVPAAGDVISHYGSYTNPDRQFVKVRDVIGGGYERYIEGLDSVNSDGTEYYFVGRQSGMYNGKPRFYIGDTGGYVEFVDGELRIKAKIVAESTVGDEPIGDYVSGVVQVGGTNMILASDKEFNAVKEAEYELAEAMVNGVSYTFTLWPHPEDAQFEYTWRVIVVDEDGAEEQVGRTTKSPDGRTTVLKFSYTHAVKSSKLIVRTSRGDYRGIFRVKLEQGNVSTDWSPSPYDLMDNSMDYIKGALKENTEIQNGLVLTSNVQVGYTDALGNRVTMAGMNGIISNAVGEKSLVFWGGGKQIDAALNPLDGAAMGVRADGSAYFAKNTVRMLGSEMQLGDNVVVSSKSMSMSDGNGNRCLVIQPQQIGYSPTNSLQGIKYDNAFLNEGELSYYTGTSQTQLRKVQMDETIYTIGTVSRGATVDGTVTLRVRDLTATGTPAAQQILSSTVIKVELCYLDGSEVRVLTSTESSALQWRRSVESSSNGVDVVRWSKSVDLSWENTGAVEYLLLLRVSAVATANSSYPTFVSSKSRQITTEISLDISGSSSRCTTHGANGFAAIWGDARLIATEDGVAMGFGDKYIRIDTTGIKINRGAGEVDL